MCGFLAIGFQFMPEGIQWIWQSSPAVAALLVVLSLVFGILWIRSQRLLKEK